MARYHFQQTSNASFGRHHLETPNEKRQTKKAKRKKPNEKSQTKKSGPKTASLQRWGHSPTLPC
jgi:hypothetical protein